MGLAGVNLQPHSLLKAGEPQVTVILQERDVIVSGGYRGPGSGLGVGCEAGR